MKILQPVKVMPETPIEEFKNFIKKKKIYLKRDDLNGLLISGNKARKLQYLIKDAINKKCYNIITCGGIQSNHCRITAVFSRIFGFECHLFLKVPSKDYKPDVNGNLLLDYLLGAKVNFVTPEEYENRFEIMEDYSRKLKNKSYIIPEGGSNEIGAFGYVDCMKEMSEFIKENNIQAIYCAVGSGGTYAGLLVGKNLLKLNLDINGVIVCDNVEYFKDKISNICNNMNERFNMKIKIEEDDIKLIDGFIGEGYAIPFPEEINLIKDISKKGIILDPVYTGKAFYGMLEDLKNKNYKKVLFIHTGGIFSIFAFNRYLI